MSIHTIPTLNICFKISMKHLSSTLSERTLMSCLWIKVVSSDFWMTNCRNQDAPLEVFFIYLNAVWTPGLKLCTCSENSSL
jgi:hypothetical protein